MRQREIPVELAITGLAAISDWLAVGLAEFDGDDRLRWSNETFDGLLGAAGAAPRTPVTEILARLAADPALDTHWGGSTAGDGKWLMIRRRNADAVDRQRLAHDLRTPLTTVWASLELALEDPALPESAESFLRGALDGLRQVIAVLDRPPAKG